MLIAFFFLLLVVVVVVMFLWERISANTAQIRMADALIVSSSGQAMGTFWLGVIASMAVFALIGIIAYWLYTKIAERRGSIRGGQQPGSQLMPAQPPQPKPDPMTMMAMMMAASVMQNMQRPANTHQAQHQYQIPDDTEVTNVEWWNQ